MTLIADLIRVHAKRPMDMPARFGGEEFVVMLPDTDLEGALRVAEHIRSAVTNAQIEHAGSPLKKVTISAGVVAIQAPEKEGYTMALAEADRLLYVAKSKGRNCVQGQLLHNCSAAPGLDQSSSEHTDA